MSSRRRVSSCFTLAPPRGPLSPGLWSAPWPDAGAVVEVQCKPDAAGGFDLAVWHNWRGGGYQLVRLAATRPNFSRGGARWWFLCPSCGSRVGRLHLPPYESAGCEFRCRRCHDLTYESAQLSRTPTRRMWLAQAAAYGCTYGQARDLFRMGAGWPTFRPRKLHFGARAAAAV